MTKLWSDDVEQPTLSRCNRNGLPYQVNRERYTSSNGDRVKNAFRGYSESTHDNQQNEQESEDTNKPQHRRRIPVACGRCRKRKIRCSGPQGDTGCQNCKAAGTNDTCQFNRVQSEELPFIKDGYSYDSVAAHRHLLRNRASMYYSPTYGDISLNSVQPYKQLSLNEYRFSTKSACYAHPYGIDYVDASADYNILPQTYQQLDQDQINLQYAPNPTPRTWTAAPVFKTIGNALYFDPDPSTTYTAPPPPQFHSNSDYGLRTSVSSESNNFSFQGLASSLPVPSPLPSNERMLPIPARPLVRTSDGVSYSSSLNANAGSAIKIMDNDISISNPQSTYIPLSTSRDGTSHSYSATDNSTEQDTYGSNSSDCPGSAQDHQPSLRSYSSQGELFNYGPRSDHVSGRTLQLDNGSVAGTGTLSNWQQYVPYIGQCATRVAQTMDEELEHIRGPVLHRESATGVRVG